MFFSSNGALLGCAFVFGWTLLASLSRRHNPKWGHVGKEGLLLVENKGGFGRGLCCLPGWD